jgi:hypothetical protein
MTFLNQTQLAHSNRKKRAFVPSSNKQARCGDASLYPPGGLVEHPPDIGKKNFLSLLKDSTSTEHYSVT